MPAPTPIRNRNVYFVGAGLSKALGLPNTAELIDGVFELAKRKKRWLISERLPHRTRDAFQYFYPDARNAGFRPDVVDFFSTLRTYIDVAAGFPAGFQDAPGLYRSLKFAIAHLLTECLRENESRLKARHSYLDQIVRPGSIVITSNWDLVLERYAQLHQVPLRYAGHDSSAFVLLKLHGSVDWCLGRNKALRYPDSDFALLNERLFANPYRQPLPGRPERDDCLLRIRVLEEWGDAWRRTISRADELHLVTMARGKAGDLGPLRDIWRDAYAALSRASQLEIVGYSLPPDDIEIRTLLRAGILRGSRPAITVKNPSPDVHERVWRYLDRGAKPDYGSVPPV